MTFIKKITLCLSILCSVGLSYGSDNQNNVLAREFSPRILVLNGEKAVNFSNDHYAINKYLINKHPINNYDMNKYDINKYLINKYLINKYLINNSEIHKSDIERSSCSTLSTQKLTSSAGQITEDCIDPSYTIPRKSKKSVSINEEKNEEYVFDVQNSPLFRIDEKNKLKYEVIKYEVIKIKNKSQPGAEEKLETQVKRNRQTADRSIIDSGVLFTEEVMETRARKKIRLEKSRLVSSQIQDGLVGGHNLRPRK